MSKRKKKSLSFIKLVLVVGRGKSKALLLFLSFPPANIPLLPTPSHLLTHSLNFCRKFCTAVYSAGVTVIVLLHTRLRKLLKPDNMCKEKNKNELMCIMLMREREKATIDQGIMKIRKNFLN